MKLAEALILRSDLQNRISQLANRIDNNIVVQEGDKPTEDPKALFKELDENLEKLTKLIQQINNTNNNTKVDGEKTLSELLAEREGLWEKRNIYARIADTASVRFDRYSQSEIKKIVTMDVSSLQKEVDDISKKWREIDTKIQGLNWTIDLLE